MTMENRLHQRLEVIGPQWIDFLKELVRIPSVLGDETACQELVRRAMRDLKLAPRRVFADNAPPYHPTGRDYAQRPCLVGTLPGSDATASAFILNAHLDTAPVEDPTTWTFPPFAAQVSQGRLYGRGALDDKAGVAMLLMLAQALQQEGVTLPGDLYLESVIEDEDSGNGTLACTRAGYLADAAVVIDGTWPFRIIDAHLGQMWLSFVISGQPAAACSWRRATHPVDVARRLMDGLKVLIDGWNQGLTWQDITSPCFVNLGSIQAGCWPGAVPERCTLQCQIGFAPPHTAASALAEVKATAAKVAHQGAAGIEVKLGSLFTDPFTMRGNPMVRLLSDNIARLRQSEMEVKAVAVSGHCDLRHLRTANGGAPAACLYGPGGGANPHVRDEYYLLDHFVPVAQNLASTILDWYGAS